MPPADRQQHLAALRATIADIERKPALAEARAQVESAMGGFPQLQGGLVQEIFTDRSHQIGAGLGFALAQARPLLTGRREAVLHLQLAGESASAGLPYAPGLESSGFASDRLILVRPADMAELLWAAEEAVSCRAVAAVIAEIGGNARRFDFTASRRLSLRASAAGCSLFLLRAGPARPASAAHLRWHLLPAPSGPRPYDARAPGAPRWQLRLERGTLLRQESGWLLDWTDHGLADVSFPGAAGRKGDGAALPRPVPAALADRLSQTA
ncbi:hypothetical protein [Devosia sp.]|uniref:ImuA family protein n=1 Tax=Devosia sp. TaxID=1871048 RepID=UPI002AFEFA68|nr:hypothetical protein [Devosia sp.]